ncbi:hypothetical protein AB0C24_24430 [Amycolatopsis japonica]|uniref:hypothetical protein n=1 Tax=Amycolatopsis japonica TaxID=208439 RepID=UPI0033C76555
MIVLSRDLAAAFHYWRVRGLLLTNHLADLVRVHTGADDGSSPRVEITDLNGKKLDNLPAGVAPPASVPSIEDPQATEHRPDP